jgi:hypothetical protein
VVTFEQSLEGKGEFLQERKKGRAFGVERAI